MEGRVRTKRDQARSLFESVNVIRTHCMARLAEKAQQRPEKQEMELTQGQLSLLHVLRRKGQATIKQLAEALHVSAPSVSAMVDRLVELGALTREHGKQDRRAVIVRMTPEAEESVGAMDELLYESIEELLDKLSPETAEQWCAVYAEIREVLMSQTGPDGRRTDEEKESKQ